MMVCCLARESKFRTWLSFCQKKMLMRIVGRMEKMGNKNLLSQQSDRENGSWYSVVANPKYIRNVISVLGLEDTRPEPTPSLKRTQTTESLVELETERRAVYRTAAGKLLYMCQVRADIMYSVIETARKIMCPTESDEMTVKRIARYLKGVPIAKCLIEINRFPPFVNEYTGRTTPNAQEH